MQLVVKVSWTPYGYRVKIHRDGNKVFPSFDRELMTRFKTVPEALRFVAGLDESGTIPRWETDAVLKHTVPV